MGRGLGGLGRSDWALGLGRVGWRVGMGWVSCVCGIGRWVGIGIGIGIVGRQDMELRTGNETKHS